MLIIQINYFSVAVTRLQDVPYFGPALPEKGRFKKNQEFREFLITKCKYAEYSYWIGTFYVQCTKKFVSLVNTITYIDAVGVTEM